MRLLGVDGPGGVEITVFLLCRADLFDQAVHVGFELGVRMNAQAVGSSFDHLVEVGVVKGIARRLLVPERFTPERGARAQEIVNASCFLALLEGERDRHCPIDFDARRPEVVAKMDGGEGHGLDGVIPQGLRGLRRFPLRWSRPVAK